MENQELVFQAVVDGVFNVKVSLKAGERLVKVCQCDHLFIPIESVLGGCEAVCRKCGNKPNINDYQPLKYDWHTVKKSRIVHSNFENRQSEIDAEYSRLSGLGYIIKETITYNDYETFIAYFQPV